MPVPRLRGLRNVIHDQAVLRCHEPARLNLLLDLANAILLHVDNGLLRLYREFGDSGGVPQDGLGPHQAELRLLDLELQQLFFIHVLALVFLQLQLGAADGDVTRQERCCFVVLLAAVEIVP